MPEQIKGGYSDPFAVTQSDSLSQANQGGYEDPYSDENFDQQDYDGFWSTMSLGYKKAYNDSIGGLIYEIQNGKKYYDVDHIDQSQLMDMFSLVGSMFASKEDLALMAASRGMGTIGVKGAMLLGGREASKELIQKFGVKALVGRQSNELAKKRTAAFFTTKTNLSKEVADDIAKDVFDFGLPGVAMYGNYEGVRLATMRTRDAMIEEGVDFSKYENMSYGEVLSEVTKNAKLSDFGKGYALGTIGGTARLSRFTPLADKVFKGRTGELTALGLEGSAVALSMGPLYEGRAPKMTDLYAAGAIMLGTRLGNSAVAKIGQRIEDVKGAKLLSEAFGGKEDSLENIIRQAAKDQIRENKVNIDVSGRSKDKKGISVFEQVAGVRTKAGRADKIIGLEVSKVSRKNKKNKKEYTATEIDRENPTAIANYDAIASANVDLASIKQTGKGTTMEITLISGPEGVKKTRYFLDEKNTLKFFDYFAETDNVTIDGLRIANKLATSRQLKNNPTILRKLQMAEFNAIKRRMNQGVDDYTAEDFKEAVLETAIELTGPGKNAKKHYFHDLIENGQLDKIKVKDLDSVTRTKLVENMYNRNQINRFVADAKRYQESPEGLMFQTIGGKDRDNNSSLMKSMLSAMGPFYYSTKDPVARRLIRTMQAINRGTNQKVSTRLDALGVLTRGQLGTMNKGVKKKFEDYLSGIGDVTGFKDFRTINSQDKGTVKRYVSNIRRKAEKLSGDEKDFELARANFLEGTQKITDDIYVDAQGVLPRLQDYVEGYIPLMFKKEVLDLLTDGSKTIAKKKDELLKKHKQTENVDELYSDDFNAEFGKALTDILRSFEKSKFKGQKQFVKIFNEYKTSLAGVNADINNFDVYRLLKLNQFNNTLKPFSPLEKPRKFFASFDNRSVNMLQNATDELLEQDVRLLLGNYITGASKRIEFSKAFGADGKLFQRMLAKIGDERMPFTKVPDFLGGKDLPLMQHDVKSAVNLMKQVFTGEINYNRNSDMYGTAIQAFQSIGNIQMSLKIGLGTAFIPNLTQTIISTAMELGPVLSMKAMAKLYVPGMQDVALQQRVSQSGATLVNTIEEMLNYSSDYARARGVARELGTSNLSTEYVIDGMDAYRKKIERTTERTATVFSIVNKGNQTIAAATFEEAVIKMGRILKGERVGLGLVDALAPEARKAWARKKLQRLGMDPEFVVKNLKMIQSGQYGTTTKTIRYRGKKKKVEVMSKEKETMLRGMQRFATKSQLQRDFTLDPYLFSDPMLKPLLLFKRFGFRQAVYAMDVVEKEFIDGNVVPLLTLGIGGVAGGSGVIWAKEQMFNMLSGEPEYYARDERQKIMESLDAQKILTNIGNVGAFGLITDIMSSEDPMDTIDFAIKPVIYDDLIRLKDSMGTFYDLAFNKGKDLDIATRGAVSDLSPVFGSILSRQIKYGFGISLGEQDYRMPAGTLTEGEKRRSVQQKRRDTIDYIKELIIQDQPKKAYQVLEKFNNTYGTRYPKSGYITPDDVSYYRIMKDKIDDIKKRREETEYKP
jgi:hypothetical protein